MPDVTVSAWRSDRAQPWQYLLLREARIFFRFTWRDLSAAVIPALLFMIAAVRASEPTEPLLAMLAALARGLPYFSLYVYSFCLSNQIAGVEEDRVNKPDRPIPAGLVSIEGAKLRWRVVMVLFPAVAFGLGGFELLAWAVARQIISVLHNFLGWSQHWFTKNPILMGLGVVAMLAPAWRMITDFSPLVWRWILLIALAVGVSISVQDLRDIEGDRLRGRKTLPLSIGETPARLLLSALCLLLPVATGLLLRGDAGTAPVALLFDLIVTGLCVAIAVRLLVLRTPSADHKTYMLWTYWYCAELLSASFVLPLIR
ncbi:UbiA family prenyltransferase [Cystobacter fuscus]